MKEKPKQSTGDIVHRAIKGALEGIPFGGGLAAEFYELIWKPPYTKRIREWIEAIAQDVKKLQAQNKDINFEELNNNDIFNTTLFHATQSAIRNHQKEKLDALRSAVMNSALPNAPEEDLQLMFLHWIDELTTWHLKILKFFDSPEIFVNKNKVAIPDWGEASPLHVFYQVYPKMRDQEQIFNLMLQDLDLKELINEAGIHNTMEKMAYLRVSHTTDLGKKFLQFIASPIEDREGR
jgi:hypothetical protein